MSAREKALRAAAAELRRMGEVWGGDAKWLTSGNHVANLSAEIVESLLEEGA